MSLAALISRVQPWIGRLQGALAVGIVLAMAIVLARGWEDVRSQPWQLNPALLALSVIVVVAAILLWAIVWAIVVRRLGQSNESVRDLAGVYIYSNLARYLPGAIWNLFARAYLGHQRGLGQRRIWTATVIDLTVAIATGLLLYAVASVAGGSAIVPAPLAGALSLALLGLVSPPVLEVVDRRLRGRGGGKVVLRWREYAAYFAISCVIWAGIGVAFYWFVAGLYPVDPSFLPAAVGLWSLAVVAGLVALGVPQGLGVKEGLLVLGLSAALPVPVATAVAIASRLWMILCDLVAVGIWWSATTIETRRRPASLTERPTGGGPG